MKKTLLTVSALFLILGATSCVKEYTCNCTYVDASGSSTPRPNKTEAHSTEARTLEFAEINCDGFELNYYAQDYDGNCTAER